MKFVLKRKRTLVTVILLLLFFSILLYAFPTGIVGRTLKNGVGCTCHSSTPSTNVNVSINGPETLNIDETADYTVTISGGPLVAAGTNIAASQGILAPGAGLREESGELTHVIPKSPESGVVTFEFTYTAPSSPGDQILFANGNSVNLNGFNSGDQWNFAPNKTISIQTVADVKDDNILSSYNLNQNYPNPFNPSTNINFRIRESGNVKIIIYNSLGDEVKILLNDSMRSGEHNINFDGKDLSSGVYYYRLITSNFSEIKKMILLK